MSHRSAKLRAAEENIMIANVGIATLVIGMLVVVPLMFYIWATEMGRMSVPKKIQYLSRRIVSKVILDEGVPSIVVKLKDGRIEKVNLNTEDTSASKDYSLKLGEEVKLVRKDYGTHGISLELAPRLDLVNDWGSGVYLTTLRCRNIPNGLDKRQSRLP